MIWSMNQARSLVRRNSFLCVLAPSLLQTHKEVKLKEDD